MTLDGTTRRGFLAGLGATVAAAAGCASIGPPIPYAASRAPASSASGLDVEPVEGRAQGLVLRLRAAESPDPGHRLVLQRRIDERPPRAIQTVELTEELVVKLTTDGIPFLDRALVDLPADTPVRYRLELRRPGAETDHTARVRASEVCKIVWPAAPPLPQTLHARVSSPRAVELRWSPADRDALVFRRDVLSGRQKPRRLATIRPDSHGMYLDRDVRPGGVYAYRIALGHPMGETHRWGAAGKALYVAIER